MQLRFTLEEITLLTTLLEDCERQLRFSAANEGGDQALATRRRKHACVEGLLDSISNAHPAFDADQLDDLVEALRGCKQQQALQLASTNDAASRNMLEERLSTLEQILDKVTEACAMF